MPARRCLSLALVALLVAGCGGANDKRVAPDAPLADQCSAVPDGARRVVVTAHDGTRLGAALLGRDDAPVGVVVNYGRSQTLCDWLPEAERLVAGNARVLVVDRRGTASSEGAPDAAEEPGDVYVAGQWLADHGTTKVAILGSSLGSVAAVATTSAVGTPRMVDVLGFTPAFTTKYCALVAVSPALHSDTIAALDVGVLPPLWMTAETGNAEIAASGEALVRRARTRAGADVHELWVDTSDHSIELVDGHEDVQSFISSAIDHC